MSDSNVISGSEVASSFTGFAKSSTTNITRFMSSLSGIPQLLSTRSTYLQVCMPSGVHSSLSKLNGPCLVELD